MMPIARATHQVTGHGGVALTVREYGRADGPPILLIHGWSQSHLSWARQLTGPLAERFRLIVPDLRGHGSSAKPDAASAYDTSAPWAGDIAAIIDTLGLRNLLLVGWSMGGWVVQDYLRLHGEAAISGTVLIGTSLTTGKYGPAEAVALRKADTAVAARAMLGDELGANIEATLEFLGACTAHPLPDRELAFMAAFNMLVPPHVRAACRMRSEDYRPVWQPLVKPVMLLWGAQERLALPPMIAEARAVLPRAQTICYDDCGHAPFWEYPDRFNRDLAEFADSCTAAHIATEGLS